MPVSCYFVPKLCPPTPAQQVVRLAHRRGGQYSEFTEFFGGNIEFGAAVDEIAFPPTIKNKPVVSGDNYLNNSRTVRKHSLGGLLGAVRSAPAWRTPSYHCYRMATPSSQRLHAGSALVTLPRRLAAENLNFYDVEASSSREFCLPAIPLPRRQS
jgi:hypothetical protein